MYRSYVMVCGGPNCTLTAGKQDRLADEFEVQIKLAGLRKEVQVMRGGCLGLCTSGPNVAIFPEGTIYSHVHTQDVAEIVNEHLLKGNRVTRLLYDENEATSTVKSLEETDFYKKQLLTSSQQFSVKLSNLLMTPTFVILGLIVISVLSPIFSIMFQISGKGGLGM